jgi:imidazolonepropionase-like amidohydrolase
MARTAIIGAAVLAPLLAACAGSPPPKKAAPIAVNEDPFPSTYRAYPGTPTVIRGATIFDGEGGQIDNGTLVLADGIVQAIGGPETPVPPGAFELDGSGKWVTPGIIDVHSHLGDYPSPGTDSHSDGNEATAPARPEVWAEHSVWPHDPGFSGPARLGQFVRWAVSHPQERASAHRPGHEVSGRTLRPEDGLRRKSEARLRQQGRAIDPHGQYRHDPCDVAQGCRLQAQVGQI